MWKIFEVTVCNERGCLQYIFQLNADEIDKDSALGIKEEPTGYTVAY